MPPTPPPSATTLEEVEGQTSEQAARLVRTAMTGDMSGEKVEVARVPNDGGGDGWGDKVRERVRTVMGVVWQWQW